MKKNDRGKRFCFSPNRMTSVYCSSQESLEEELSKFEVFLQNKGWSQWVQIGRFDEGQNVFDFKIHTMELKENQWIEIVLFFLDQGFWLDEDWCEPYEVQKI